MFEEIEHVLEVNEVNVIRNSAPRVFRNRIDPFDIYSNSEFRQRYRLTKECARYIITLVERRLRPLQGTIYYITPTFQVLITLRYYAKGCYQVELGEFKIIIIFIIIYYCFHYIQ